MKARTVIACLVAAASLLLLMLLLEHGDLARQMFQDGNIFNLNYDSNITTQRAEELLRHVEVILLGIACMALLITTEALARALARRHPRLGEWLPRVAPFVLVSLVAVVVAVPMILGRSVMVDGQRHFFLLDDAMNSMRYARNFAEGHGLAYNPGDRVEGYTNFLWVLVMAAIHRLGASPASAPLWVLVVSWACLLATACLAVDMLRRLELGPFWCVCVGLLVVCDENDLAWTNCGLETAALTTAVTACAWAIVSKQWRAFAVALALIPLLRADGFVIGAALAAVALLQARRTGQLTGGTETGRVWRALLPAVLLLGAHLIFRRVYYGYWLPNTYYLRMFAVADRLKTGVGGYGLRLAIGYPFFLLLCAGTLLGRSFAPVMRLLAGVVFMQLAYSIWIGSDIFVRVRFAEPVLPLLFVCALLALHRIAVGSLNRERLLQAVALGSCCALSSALPADCGFEGRSMFLSMFGLARLFEKNLPPGASSTVYAAGTVPYYANHAYYVDVLGKNDSHVAHLAQHNGLITGHNKADFPYIYDQLKPSMAFIFNPCSTIRTFVTDPSKRAETLGKLNPTDFITRYLDMTNPTFVSSYFPNQVRYVGYPSPSPVDCVFVRSGSDIPLFWSPAGPPPRERDLRLSCELRDSEKPAAFVSGWSAAEQRAGRTVRDLLPGAPAVLDVWMAIDEPAAFELCVAAPSAELELTVNGTPLRMDASEDAACQGTLVRGTVPVEVLRSNRSVTRIEVRAPGARDSVAVDWIHIASL